MEYKTSKNPGLSYTQATKQTHNSLSYDIITWVL